MAIATVTGTNTDYVIPPEYGAGNLIIQNPSTSIATIQVHQGFAANETEGVRVPPGATLIVDASRHTFVNSVGYIVDDFLYNFFA